MPVFGIGKIHDIYNGRGVDDYVTTKSNADGMEKLSAAARDRKHGLIFCNLVDFDMLYGHRKDVEGFARSLEEFDAALTAYLPLTQPARSPDSDRRPRLRSRSSLGNHRSFARVRPYPGLFSRAKNRQEPRYPLHPRRHGANHRRKFRRQHSSRHQLPRSPNSILNCHMPTHHALIPRILRTLACPPYRQ